LEFVPVLLMFLFFALNIPVAFGIAMAAMGYFLLSPDVLMGVFVQRCWPCRSSSWPARS
jgi:hypothetical protein